MKRKKAKTKKVSRRISPLVGFDMKNGVWLVYIDVMERMIKKGLRKSGLSSGQRSLKEAYDLIMHNLGKREE